MSQNTRDFVQIFKLSYLLGLSSELFSSIDDAAKSGILSEGLGHTIIVTALAAIQARQLLYWSEYINTPACMYIHILHVCKRVRARAHTHTHTCKQYMYMYILHSVECTCMFFL